jgi:hypothetical protein
VKRRVRAIKTVIRLKGVYLYKHAVAKRTLLPDLSHAQGGLRMRSAVQLLLTHSARAWRPRQSWRAWWARATPATASSETPVPPPFPCRRQTPRVSSRRGGRRGRVSPPSVIVSHTHPHVPHRLLLLHQPYSPSHHHHRHRPPPCPRAPGLRLLLLGERDGELVTCVGTCCGSQHGKPDGELVAGPARALL